MNPYLLALPFAAAIVDAATRRGYAAVAASAALLALTGLSNPLVFLLNSLYLIISIYSLWYIDVEKRGWYWGWMDAFYGSMLAFLASDNWLVVAAGWGGLDAASWALILTHEEHEDRGWVGDGARRAGITWLWRPSDSALRAMATVELGTAALLIGLAQGASLYGPNIGEWGVLPPLAAAAVMLAAFVKSAQLPFTDWLMTAMSAPTPVSALLHSATMVAAGPILLLRLSPALAPYWPYATAVGLATALYGGVVALWQREPKVVLASSTASYLGLATALAVESPAAAAALVMAHGYSKAALFMAVGEGIHEQGTRTPSGYSPLAKAAIAVALANLLGFMPLGGLAKSQMPLWAEVFSALTFGYVVGKLLLAKTEGRPSPLSALALVASLMSLYPLSYRFDPLWLLALAGAVLVKPPHVEALARRLYLPVAFAEVGSAAASAFRSFGLGDSAVDSALWSIPRGFLAAARAVARADFAVDSAFHSSVPSAVMAASKRISSIAVETYLYAVGAAALAVVVALFLL
ncbi:MAG: proton-conducting transporter membrane subunit [Thermoproteus sp. AZ2]|jgi:NADH:ubiquinone oxidoreductase subunit 5 (subunit L)/multisubunit Na+/H+ antiporter MnhA subunit|uniref:Proton-conducting transporter membrane subunit n=1 Tax=Thermoproteus sp. AZ2 TaxID=1609232 RepID=A0ACC6V2E3_9CREN|nr:MAG: NADH-quinone oxidoreductase subunit L [Thermoproteus sp. AZ2]